MKPTSTAASNEEAMAVTSAIMASTNANNRSKLTQIPDKINNKNNNISCMQNDRSKVEISSINPDELIDSIVIGATHPYKYFQMPLSKYALITIECQESNTSGRCELLMSCTHAWPSIYTAAWSYTSANTVKRFQVHPADDNYTLGNFYIALHYLESAGTTVAKLRVHTQPIFTSVWLRRSLYSIKKESSSFASFASLRSTSLPLTRVANNNNISSSRIAFTEEIDSCKDSKTVLTLENNNNNDKNNNNEESKESSTYVPNCISLYCGEWKGKNYHGRGVILYEIVRNRTSTNYKRTDCSDDTKITSTPPTPTTTTTTNRITRNDNTESIYAHNLESFTVRETNMTQSEKCECEGAQYSVGRALSIPRFSLLTETMLERPCMPYSMLTLPVIDAINSNLFSKENNITYGTTEAEQYSDAFNASEKKEVNRQVILQSLRNACNMPDQVSFESAHGWRILTPLPDGVEAYDGEWHEHTKSGKGIYQWADRAYVGSWEDGMRNGYGVLYGADGSWYKGEWKNDARHGYGEALFVTEQVIYRGSWADGKPNGNGVMIYLNNNNNDNNNNNNSNINNNNKNSSSSSEGDRKFDSTVATIAANVNEGTQVCGSWVNGMLQPEVKVIYPTGETYVGGWLGKMRHGRGTLTDQNGCQHHHYWCHDKREGEGEMIMLVNAVRFIGKWRNDMVLQGAYHFSDGAVYCGEWDSTQQCRHGSGRCEYANGDVYDGEWKQDKRHGHGIMKYHAAGATYDGDWVNDERNGEGTLIDDDGVYTGHFTEDRRSGYGLQQYKKLPALSKEDMDEGESSYYRGNWQNGFKSGWGVYYNAEENITYTGMFLHDRLHGTGSCTDATLGESYDGNWLDGHKQGRGTIKLANGDVLHGIWHRGNHECSKVTFHSANGEHYIGDWVGGEPHGHGVRFNKDGSVYDGEWDHGTYTGIGILIKRNGETICGQWVHGQLTDGDCELTFSDGSVYCGQLSNGVPHGQGKLTYSDGTLFEGHFRDGTYIL